MSEKRFYIEDRCLYRGKMPITTQEAIDLLNAQSAEIAELRETVEKLKKERDAIALAVKAMSGVLGPATKLLGTMDDALGVEVPDGK